MTTKLIRELREYAKSHHDGEQATIALIAKADAYLREQERGEDDDVARITQRRTPCKDARAGHGRTDAARQGERVMATVFIVYGYDDYRNGWVNQFGRHTTTGHKALNDVRAAIGSAEWKP